MTGSNNKLTKRDYTVAMLRAYYLQNGFNYSNYQGLGYSLVMYKGFKKLYKDNPKKLSEELLKNCEFYNTNPNLLPFITSMHLAMADSGMEYDEIRGIKMALMGPLAGIGDSLSQFCIAPLNSTIFSSLALQNVFIAPILFLISQNGILLGIKYFMGEYGRKLGTSMIDKLSSKMGDISDAASMVGVTVIAGLAATFVKMNVNIKYSATGIATAGTKIKELNIQAMLDKVAPALLPILYTMFMYYLIKKRGWTTYKLVVLTVILGVLLSYFGILV